MTLSTTTNRAAFLGTDTTGPFPFAFPFATNSEITVFTAKNGIITDLADSEYTLLGAGLPSGGSVITANPVPTGTTLFVLRVLPLDQTTDFRNQGSFYAETHEETFDRLEKQIQQLQEQIIRCARMPKNIGADQTFSPSRNSTILGFDSSGALAYFPTVTFSISTSQLVFVSNTYTIASDATDLLLINADATDCIITPAAGDTICREDTYTLTVLDETVRIVKNGTNWFQVK